MSATFKVKAHMAPTTLGELKLKNDVQTLCVNKESVKYC